MAVMVTLNVSGSPGAAQVASAIREIRQGIAILQSFEGMRQEAIGAGDSGVTMQDVFGVDSAAHAQALATDGQRLSPPSIPERTLFVCC